MVMMSGEATAFSSLTSSLYPFYSPIGIYRAKISGALCNVLRSILRSILRRILAATRLLPRTISDLVFLSIFQTPLDARSQSHCEHCLCRRDPSE